MYHKGYHSTKVLFSKNGNIQTTRIYFNMPEAITYKYVKKYRYHKKVPSWYHDTRYDT